MPNKDRTGPEGKGSKTGRKLGRCVDAEPEESRMGRGIGRGFNKPRRFKNQK